MPTITSRHDYTDAGFCALPAYHRPKNKGAPRTPVYSPAELADYFNLTKRKFQRLLDKRSGPKPSLVVRNRSNTADLTYYNRLEVAAWLARIGAWEVPQS
jgi:hypothetical protein